MFHHFLNKVSFPPSCCFSISSQVRTIGTLLIRFHVRQFSSASSSSTPQPHCKPVEEDEVRVSVWWNFNDCRVPSGVSVSETVPKIMEAVRSNGIKGPIDIQAYGDVFQFSKLERRALSSMGIPLRHYAGQKRRNNANRYLFLDLHSWSLHNPPPVHIFLIVGKARLPLLHMLRMSNYNILVAYQGRAPEDLCSATTIMWQWSSILKGEDLTGKHFNYPPDGPFNSWYGNLKLPLEISAAPSTQKLGNGGKNMDRNADGIPIISSLYVSSVDDDSKSFQSIPSQGKPIGEYVDCKSSFPVREVSSSPLPHRNCSCNVSVWVWWDVDNCGLPSGFSSSKVAPSILATVRANGIKGKININAFGDFSKVDKEELLSTGISIHSNPAGKNNSYYRLLMNLSYWVHQNPPPAHIFLILGDKDNKDFSGILHRLRMNNYNILIACSGRASDILCSAANVMLSWSSMLMGVDLIRKHFNYPLDGHFNLTYGDSNIPLGNPLSAIEESTSSQNAKIHKLFSDIKSSEVPNSVFGQVGKISSSSLNGISHGDLHAELRQFSSASSSTPQPHCKPVEEDRVKVSVLWDFESCGVPSGVSYLKVAPSIMGALRTKGFNGPIHIQAYGNVNQLSEINQEMLFLTGINLHHIPGGSGNSNSYRYLLDWISQNPPPAHLFMISGNENNSFNALVYRLTWVNYNILFACPRKPEDIIYSSSTIMWCWPLMLKGKYLTGRHFKDPPKWCRIPRMPLENRFTNPLEVPLEDPFLDHED